MLVVVRVCSSESSVRRVLCSEHWVLESRESRCTSEVPSLHLTFTHLFVSMDVLILIRRLQLQISENVNLNILNTFKLLYSLFS